MWYLERSHLEIFRALAEEGTLVRASERLNLTQPALTHSVRKLESLLGVNLVERVGRRVSLTSAGERLVRAAGQILPRLEKTEEDLRRLARGELPVLRIGVECHPCYQWLLQVIERFLAESTQEVEVLRRFQFAAVEALLHQKVDLVVTPDPYRTAALEWVPVLDYSLVAVLGADHALAQKAWLDPEDFLGETLLTYPVEETRLDVFTRFLLPRGVRPQRVRAEETHELMLVLAARGRGIAVLPDWLVGEQPQGLVLKPLGREGLPKQLFLGYRRENREDAALRRFVELALGRPLSA